MSDSEQIQAGSCPASGPALPIPRAGALRAAYPALRPDAAAAARGSDRTRRLLGLVSAMAAGAVLLLAAWLQPAEAGLGTHEQLSLPPCGWITLMDTPCPTCGMTTAFAHAAHGHLLASAQAQPLGFLLALATGIVLLVGLYTAATGSRVAGAFARLWGRRTGWLVAALVLGAWAYKIITYKGLL